MRLSELITTALLLPAALIPELLAGRDTSVDSLLTALDRAIERRGVFESAKLQAIDSVKATPVGTLPAEGHYRVNKELVELYRSYIYDSALRYVTINQRLAAEMHDRRRADESRIDYCNMLLKGGLFKEALDNMALIDRRHIDPAMLPDYWLCYEQIYHHMSRYTAGTSFEEHYAATSRSYVDSLHEAVEGDSDHYFALSRIYASDPDKRMARARLQNLLDRLRVGTHGYAIVSSTLANCYSESDPDERLARRKCLILSSISDITSTVKEYVSLSNLAAMFYAEGDTERAYRYVAISMEDANHYNARLRRFEMSLIFPIIERAYKTELDNRNRGLTNLAIVIGLGAMMMLALVLFVSQQTVALRRARRALLEANASLTSTNSSLIEANHIKEEYLGRFLTLCSTYIGKMERYQSALLNKMNAGRIDELRAMVRSSSVVEHEIKEFYQNFDRSFLSIFPNFVQEFNALLREGEEIEVPRGEWLVTELRIFALIRLGIHDSSQIARFLRYSANTVYTYRTKVKNKARDRTSFEREVMNIGLV